MKQTIITILLAFFALSASSQIHYRLEGNIGHPEFTGRLALKDYFGVVIDSVDIEKGEIKPIEGTLPDTAICSMIEKSANIWLSPIFIGGGTTHLDGDTMVGPRISGTPLCDDYTRLRDTVRMVLTETLRRDFLSGKRSGNLEPDENGKKRIADAAIEIISRHTSDMLGYYLLREGTTDYGYLQPEQWLALSEKMLPWLKTRPSLYEDLTTTFIPLKEMAARTGVGCKFVDVEADVDGHTFRLSDYVGRGNYAVVNFWGTTCPPCIAELPDLIQIYQQYGSRGLTVVGIPAFEEIERSRKGIEKHQLPYPQLLNTQKKAAKAYGILGIPETILFSPDGTILARGLRMEELKTKLKEIFGE